MKSVCFFNNKGGVGKTTLLCNVASYVATEFGKRTLIIDADPQCNATQLVLGEQRIYDLYRTRSTKFPPTGRLGQSKSSSHNTTLFDVLRPIAIGESDIANRVVPFSAKSNMFGVALLPGDPRVALMEDNLSQAWLELIGGKLGGARKTNWNTQLCKMLDEDYDVVFIDVGPSLGALNRCVLVGADYFAAPMGCDIFSLLGVTNIANWLREWISRYERAIEQCRTDGFAEDLKLYPIHTDTAVIVQFIGYTVQQYITKSKGGTRRATRAFETILKKIPETVHDNLKKYVPSDLDEEDLQLPDVPHMYSLVPLSQAANCPIHRLDSSDGLVGTQYAQRDSYAKFIRSLATSLLRNLGIKVR